MRNSNPLKIIGAALIVGYATALLAAIPLIQPQTAPYNVCVMGQAEPDCQRESGTKGIAYKGFPINTQKLFLVKGRWQVFEKIDLYGVPTLLINAGIFSSIYAVTLTGVLKYAHTRD